MGKYLKKFNTHSGYQNFTQTEDFILPNVSICILEKHVHYNPKLYEENIIYAKFTVANNETYLRLGEGMSSSGGRYFSLSNILTIIINDLVFEAVDNSNNFYCEEADKYINYEYTDSRQTDTRYSYLTEPGNYSVLYILKEGRTSNGNYCIFKNNSQVTEVVFPKLLKTINSSEFYNCTNLENIIILGVPVLIGDLVSINSGWYNNQPDMEPLLVNNGKVMLGFKNQNSSAITNLNILNGVESFFSNIETINIPESVKYINLYYHTNYYTLYFAKEDPTDYAIYNNDYIIKNSINKIYVPANSVNSYKEALPLLANKIYAVP